MTNDKLKTNLKKLGFTQTRDPKKLSTLIIELIFTLMVLAGWVFLFILSWKITLCIFVIEWGNNRSNSKEYVTLKYFNDLKVEKKCND
jgi:hypothetical protein